MIKYKLLLLSLSLITAPAMAQRFSLPPRPLRISLELPSQNGNTGLSGTLSLDIRVKKVTPLLGLYVEGNSFNFGGGSFVPLNSSYQTSTTKILDQLSGQGVLATWSVHKNVQYGLGIGIYSV